MWPSDRSWPLAIGNPTLRGVRTFFLVLGLLGVVACGSGRGDKEMGEPCEADTECRHQLCVAGVAGPTGVCTRSCRPGGSECPESWFCSAATQSNVVVCSRQAATPFGQ